MSDKIQINRILAFGIILLAVSLLILPSSLTELWDLEPWSLFTFRVIANLTASMACIIAIVLIWKRPSKAFVLDLALFLSLGALTYGTATLDPITNLPVLETLRLLLLTILAVLTPTKAIRFIMSFRSEFNIAEPIRNKQHRSQFIWVRNTEWFFQGSRQVYTSAALIIINLLWRIFQGDFVLFFVIVIFFGLSYFPYALMLLYRYTAEIHKKRILWIAYGFYGGCVTPIFFQVASAILKIAGHQVSGLYQIGFALGALILVLSFAISLFATDAFNVQVVIRRTIAYGALSLILVFLFAVLEEVLIRFLGNYFEALVKYNSLLMAGLLAVIASLIKKVIDPIVGKYLRF